jgi:hypothetical protein
MHALLVALALAATPPGTYALGDVQLAPGMTLRVFHGDSEQESGRLRVLSVDDGEARLELLSGSPELDLGDRIEVLPEPREPGAPR